MMNSRSRIRVAGGFTLFLFSAILFRLGYLQLYIGTELSAKADRNRSRHMIDQVSRGAILDRHGSVLAISIEGGACFVDPKLVKRPVETAQALAPVINLPVHELKAKLMQKRRFVWLARRLDPATAESIRALNLKGIYVLKERKRFYPEETLASSLLGVVNENQEGLSGIERTADLWLRGRSTPVLFKDWTVNKKAAEELASRKDLPEQSIVLSIDRTLQTIAEQELIRQIALSRAKSGMVIIQDPHTGEILAMASVPTFNPNLWGTPAAPASYTSEILKNPNVEHIFEPGSTYKIVTAAAALQEQKITPEETVFCENGRWKIAGRFIKDHESDGWLSFIDVMGHSSNIGTAKVASRLGPQGLYRYSRAFGFGMPSGCGLPGDGSGILRQTQQWSGASLETISFGQEIGVTALQLVNAYSAIANGGTLLEPRLFRGVVDDERNYREWMMRQPIRQVVSARTAETVRNMLKHVVVSGTGKAAQVEGITVAGKTGTAQKINPLTRQYDTQRYIASFCGFAPAENPRLVIGVFLDEPQASIWGGSEAAPLFARVLRGATTYLRMPKTPSGSLLVSRVVPKARS